MRFSRKPRKGRLQGLGNLGVLKEGKKHMATSIFLVAFAKGFWAPIGGLAFLRKTPVLWRYVWIPALLNVVLFAVLGALFLVLFPHLVGLVLPQGDAWYLVILRAIMWVLGSVLVLLLFLVSFTSIGTAVAGPFNELLSERVEELKKGSHPRSEGGLWPQVRRSARSIVESLKYLAAYLLGSLLILLLGLLPAVGPPISTVLGAAWTFLFLALEFGDYYLARHWVRFKERWSIVWSHKWASMGFGAGCSLLLLIPLLNLLLMPGAVTGGTLLWLELKPHNATGHLEHESFPGSSPQSSLHQGRGA